ncbi:Transferase [Sesbania bispinosa]|nr:Transferase [Sesbania bispinosa]
MEQSRAVKVVQECQVSPAEEGTTSMSLPFTFFDVLWLRSPPVDRIFFYEYQNSTSSFFDSVLPNLKHSLSLTLQHFLPLAGKITWPLDSSFPIINYVPGDAISFTVAESNYDNFNHLCSNFCEVVELHPLIPHLPTSHEQASVLALQVTLFPGSGFCIGIASHHAVMDGKSSILFLKAWAYACSKLLEESSFLTLPEHLTPFYDRSMIEDTTGIGARYVKDWLNLGGPNNRSLKVLNFGNTISNEATKGSFELTSSHIQKLKQHAQSELKINGRLSTFSVACAYVSQCLVKTEQPKTKGVAFTFSVDCRSRLDPPIPSTYFGNCIVGHRFMDETHKLLGNEGFINACEGLNEALKRLEDGVLNGALTMYTLMQFARDNRILSIGGSPRFEVYSVDFGWGRPKKVDMTLIGETAAFSLSESRNDSGGIEIGLVLNKSEMEAFSSHFFQGLKSL